MAISLHIDQTEILRMQKVTADLGKDYEKELARPIRQTAKFCKSFIAKLISKKVAIPQKAIKAGLHARNVKRGDKGTVVTLKYAVRPSLKYYKPRQTGAGVTYKIDKEKGRKVAPGAFMGARPGRTTVKLGGHAYKRVFKQRLPIVKLHAVSYWATFNQNKYIRPTVKATEARLRKEIISHTNFLIKKSLGRVRGKQR